MSVEQMTKMGKVLLRLERHFGDLAAAVEHLDSYSRTLAVRQRRIEEAVALVCESFGITRAELLRSKKRHTPTEARLAVILLLRESFDAPISEIAHYLPYGVQTVRNRISEVKQLRSSPQLLKLRRGFFEKLDAIKQQTENQCQTKIQQQA